jgi:hypothetical protein
MAIWSCCLSDRSSLQDLLEVQKHFGLPSPALVEKDWYVVKALAALVAVDAAPFRLVFGGGTALSRAHRLIRRMSEDIDLKIISDTTVTRPALRHLRDIITKALLQAGCYAGVGPRVRPQARGGRVGRDPTLPVLSFPVTLRRTWHTRQQRGLGTGPEPLTGCRRPSPQKLRYSNRACFARPARLPARSGCSWPIFDSDLAEFRAEPVRPTLGAALRRRPRAAPRTRALCPLRNYRLTVPSLSHLALPRTPQRNGPQARRLVHATESGACRAAETSSTNSIRIGSREGTPFPRVSGHEYRGLASIHGRAGDPLGPRSDLAAYGAHCGISITGFARLLDDEGEIRWKLLRIIPVMTVSKPEITRSAAGRVMAESVWLPSALCRDDAAWTGQNVRHPQVRLTVEGRNRWGGAHHRRQ